MKNLVISTRGKVHRPDCGHAINGDARPWTGYGLHHPPRECGHCRPFHVTRITDQWTGKRVLRRLDSDGTQWTIRQNGDGMWLLMCSYRDHTLTSKHPSPATAQAHRDDLTASWRAARLHDYQQQPFAGVH
jgi:hypothetical protein